MQYTSMNSYWLSLPVHKEIQYFNCKSSPTLAFCLWIHSHVKPHLSCFANTDIDIYLPPPFMVMIGGMWLDTYWSLIKFDLALTTALAEPCGARTRPDLKIVDNFFSLISLYVGYFQGTLMILIFKLNNNTGYSVE